MAIMYLSKEILLVRKNRSTLLAYTLLCLNNIYLNAKGSQPFNICVFFSMVQVRIFI